ncbi:MAG: GNAT family N-acetyltransferase [Acidobacteria bacterium]|nr:GNAT family N-acetyltransferase [Acidobacteriota bacterium]
MIIEPIVLQGEHVRLEPLTLAHHAALWEAGNDERIWRWYPAPVRTADEMRAWIGTALEQQAAGLALPFVTIARGVPKGRDPVAGSTRYMNIDPANRRVEIGSTWLHPRFQRTALNTEAKYLLLRHAFESLGCVRVEFKTDSLNDASRRALLRIGAKEEGTFRNHMVTASGRLRHSVWFSVVAGEWLAVKSDFERKLSSRGM